jgi:hypothetical protein
MPKILRSTISPLGYALAHMTTSHKTAVLFPLGLINMRARPLVKGTPELPISDFPKWPLHISPPGYALIQVTTPHKTSFLFLSGFINTRARPLVNGTPEFPMDSSFQDFPRNPRLQTRVLHGWTVQIISRLRQVRSQNTHLPLLFPDVRIPKWVISRHVSSLNRTVQIYFGTSTMECPDLLSSRPLKS